MDFLCIVLRAAGRAIKAGRTRLPFGASTASFPWSAGKEAVPGRNSMGSQAQVKAWGCPNRVSALVACFPGHDFGVHEGEARCCEFTFQVCQKLPTGMV